MEMALKQFDNPDEVTTFDKGKFETVTLGGMTIGRATYMPGWKWSSDVGQPLGKDFCDVDTPATSRPTPGPRVPTARARGAKKARVTRRR